MSLAQKSGKRGCYAKVSFKEAGLIEKYGTGIRRILTGFKNYGLPALRFEEFSGGFRVTVYKQAGQVATAEVTDQVTGEVAGEEVASDSRQVPGKSPRKKPLSYTLLRILLRERFFNKPRVFGIGSTL